MDLQNSFRDKHIAQVLLRNIRKTSKKQIRLMEVCGGHTMSIRRYGIHNLLPENIELLSGPGCPVCVSSQGFIDKCIAYSRMKDVILTSYGDLLKVPGSHSSLDHEKAKGANVVIVNSTLETLNLARKYPGKKVIFAGIGFETTTPGSAIAILTAEKEGLNNFFIISAHKVMPPAMGALLEEGIPIDGYIGPGHVCTIAGSKIFNDIPDLYKVPVVISGFEPIDLLQSIAMLVKNIESHTATVDIQYNRLVSEDGNRIAQSKVSQVFEYCRDDWRGIGEIEDSGLKIREGFKRFDAEKAIQIEIDPPRIPKGCICGQILKGLNKPTDCKLFGKSCIPTSPIGACMVSSEGSCNAYYSYGS